MTIVSTFLPRAEGAVFPFSVVVGLPPCLFTPPAEQISQTRRETAADHHDLPPATGTLPSWTREGNASRNSSCNAPRTSRTPP